MVRLGFRSGRRLPWLPIREAHRALNRMINTRPAHQRGRQRTIGP